MFGSGPTGTTLVGLIWKRTSRQSWLDINASSATTHHGVTPVIVRLDMLEIARVLECRDVPVQLAHPQVEVRVPIPDRADVALEVTNVYRVETDLRC